jgi:prolyl-tRNA synthetase
LYNELTAAGVEVILDDRNERAGVMFADMELIGIPHRIVVGDRGLTNNLVEYKGRRDTENQDLPLDGLVAWLAQKISG